MKNQISTIQLRIKVKQDLDKLRKKPNESYEEIIVKLINENGKKDQDRLLKEQCIEMYNFDKKTSAEWDNTLLDGLEEEKW